MNRRRGAERLPWEIQYYFYPDGDVDILVRSAEVEPGSGIDSEFGAFVLAHATCAICGEKVSDFDKHIACLKSNKRAFIAKLRMPKEHSDYIQKVWLEDRRRANNERRKYRLSIAGGSHTHEELRRVFEIQQGHCFYCYCELMFNGDPAEVHRDHFIPVALGGGDGIDNIVLACSRCNHDKGIQPGPMYFDNAIKKIPWNIRRKLITLRNRRVRNSSVPLDSREDEDADPYLS